MISKRKNTMMNDLNLCEELESLACPYLVSLQKPSHGAFGSYSEDAAILVRTPQKGTVTRRCLRNAWDADVFLLIREDL
jgi:hypothetical protein